VLAEFALVEGVKIGRGVGALLQPGGERVTLIAPVFW